jgi:hypothetical protein
MMTQHERWFRHVLRKMYSRSYDSEVWWGGPVLVALYISWRSKQAAVQHRGRHYGLDSNGMCYVLLYCVIQVKIFVFLFSKRLNLRDKHSNSTANMYGSRYRVKQRGNEEVWGIVAEVMWTTVTITLSNYMIFKLKICRQVYSGYLYMKKDVSTLICSVCI